MNTENTEKTTRKITYLKDYQRPIYTITQAHLTFDLHDTKTRVHSRLQIEGPTNHPHPQPHPLVLQGVKQKLISVKVEERELSPNEYRITEESLTIPNTPSPSPSSPFIVEIETVIDPSANKSLEGLYKSGGIFCTQNEPEGFRHITYYIDRPDVMAKFTTKIIAEKKDHPVLLSNGNLTDKGELSGGRHWAQWEDPFPKPCYLYALVAGDLGLVRDEFTTMSGRSIELRLYCDKGNESKCRHAMNSLKAAMKWDEETYGLEYDLDIYMIVAVDAFNMGAMENKGLNIFNTSCVLANPEMATDRDFIKIEGVVAHEYFHNWTGNRVTCRDWFQLTLKEGLTVFRDQKFSQDMNSAIVQRIDDVMALRQNQFVEDAGPMAHPIRPPSYMEINNFYTTTIYEKGAEVIRMIETLLGPQGFRKGMDKYFELYDGQAVTTEDFIHAMSVANDFDFSALTTTWYTQAGTPELHVTGSYDETKKTYTLTVAQSCPPDSSPSEAKKKAPFYLPLALGLVGRERGEDIPLQLEMTTSSTQPQQHQPDIEGRGILHIKKEREEFVFKGVDQCPIVSLNRNFNAPVKCHFPYKDEELAFLMGHDSDGFNRYDSAQQLNKRVLLKLIRDRQAGKELKLSPFYLEAYGKALSLSLMSQETMASNHAVQARILELPTEDILHQEQEVLDFVSTHEVRRFVKDKLAMAHGETFKELYHSLDYDRPYSLDPKAMGERALKNTALGFLMSLAHAPPIIERCFTQFEKSDNMTDTLAALALLANTPCPQREDALAAFYERWKDEPLVVQKWMAIQARSSLPDTFGRVKQLQKHPAYDQTIPNYLYALLGVFTTNHIAFHQQKSPGDGYHFIANQVIHLDCMNHLVAARLAKAAFRQFKRFPEPHKDLARVELERIRGTEGTSKNVYEITDKILS